MSKQSRRKKQEREKNRRQWHEENDALKNCRIKAPHTKAFLRLRGYDLPFYDLLDSYSDEFQRIAARAKSDYSSLLGIHEVDNETFAEPDQNWSSLGYGELQQIIFDWGNDAPDYGDRSMDATLAGSMSAFLDDKQNLRSVILIKQSIKTDSQHRELKYVLKIASLLHEIGHVHDLEQGINFDVSGKRFKFNVIEGEVYAHLFALEQMAQRNLRQSFLALKGGLRDAIPKGGYVAEVAQRVLDRMPHYELKDWQPELRIPLTPEEKVKLGPHVVRSISNWK